MPETLTAPTRPTPRPRYLQDFIDMSWHDRGLCNDPDTDDTLFYHPEGERGAARVRRAEAAKEICATCPVMAKCKAEALRVREPYGTWGGLSEDERKAILSGKPLSKVKARQAADAAHARTLAPLVLTVPPIPPLTMTRRVPSGRVVEHLQRLRADGYTFTAIARTAGLHHTSLAVLERGERASLTERVARLILAVRPKTETTVA